MSMNQNTQTVKNQLYFAGFFRSSYPNYMEYGFLRHPILGFFALICYLLFVCAILSHDPVDFSVLEGGMFPPYRNWIGFSGAYLSRLLFFLFGIGTYILTTLLGLSLLRSLLPFKTERRMYWLGYIFVMFSSCAWLAMYPENDCLSQWTMELGIGQMLSDVSVSNLTGGTIGQFVASPYSIEWNIPAGFVRRFIGDNGTLIVIVSLLVIGLLILFYEDWFHIVLYFARRNKGSQSARQQPAPVVQPEPAYEPEIEPNSDVLPGMEDDNTSPGQNMGFTNDSSSAANDVNVKAPVQTENGMAAPGMVNYGDETEENGEELADEDAEEDGEGYVILPPRGFDAAGSQPQFGDDEKEEATPLPEQNANLVEEEPQPVPVAPQPPPPKPQPACQPLHRPVAEPPVKMQPQTPSVPVSQYSNRHEDAGVTSSRICENYVLPSVRLLDPPKNAKEEDTGHIEKMSERLQKTLDNFGVEAHVTNIIVGPRVTRFELSLAGGVAVERVTKLQDTIAMRMEAKSVRVLAPVPGKDAVGIEVPNKESSVVYIRSIMECPEWTNSNKLIPIVLGRDVEGKAVVTDLSKAPHMLIAGSTGSGKSVCMNTLIQSLLFKFSPDELRLILVDPKVVEMDAYTSLPHLITPVVNDPKKVPLALRWGVNEMEHRYHIMAKVHQKDLKTFNKRPQDPEPIIDDDGRVIPQKLPFLIIIIDELADIMMTDAKKDVETCICRIAQKGRAAGVHLVIATQTPRKDIVTGLIKANLPVKIAFKVGNNMDSRVILDQGGAEKLLGMGDLLFNPPGASNLERIQMTLVTDEEIKRVVDFVSMQAEQHFNTDVLSEPAEDGNGENVSEQAPVIPVTTWNGGGNTDDSYDDSNVPNEAIQSVIDKYIQPGDGPLMRKVLELIILERQASISLFQRRLGIGYNKSAELVDQLERRNIISRPLGGGQKRDIHILEGLEINEKDQ